MASEPKKQPSFKFLRELAAGGISCAIVSALLNPMDVIKVRLQTQNQLGSATHHIYKGFSHAAQTIIKEEGIIGLWTPGLVASMLREISYSSLRIGLYPISKELWSPKDGSHSLVSKIMAGLTSGAIGSMIANPTDLVKIRQQGEAGLVKDGIFVTGLHKGHPPSYKNAFHAFYVIGREEGFKGLYKGSTATVTRAAFLTAGQLASYDHSKHWLLSRGYSESLALHIFCSFISGLCATTAAAPADIIKTRIMNDRDRAAHGGKALYKGVVDCLWKTLTHEGPQALFKGWIPSYLRLGPHFLISLPLLEEFRKFFGLGFL